MAYAYARAGQRAEALHQLARLRELANHRYVPAFLFAIVHIGLGEHDEAIASIEREFDARGWYLLLINQGPQFDPLRSQPRFQQLLRRMGFAEAQN